MTRQTPKIDLEARAAVEEEQSPLFDPNSESIEHRDPSLAERWHQAVEIAESLATLADECSALGPEASHAASEIQYALKPIVLDRSIEGFLQWCRIRDAQAHVRTHEAMRRLNVAERPIFISTQQVKQKGDSQTADRLSRLREGASMLEAHLNQLMPDFRSVVMLAEKDPVHCSLTGKGLQAEDSSPMRNAAWFKKVTGGHLENDTLRNAIQPNRLVEGRDAKKLGGRWFYDVHSVMREWPHHTPRVQDALAGETRMKTD